ALLNQKLNFKNVGLVVVDEQHRFGVRQRAILKDKGMNPHLLSMTATPIPRTVALTLFGELDISVIDEMPKDRLPIKSYVVPTAKRQAGYEWIAKQIRENGDQVYIICPLIEESEVESMKSIRAAMAEFEHLQKSVFPDFKMGLLHGKMKPAEKEEAMRKFKEKEYDILVSTSVVEVGIDVPNATIIVIEGAERFGMAQLHQLRGRVGRGHKQSYCYLFATFSNMESSKRLTFFAEHNKGIDIAEFDLQHRGTGEIYGTRQSGTSDLAIANLSDLPFIEKTKHAADEFVKDHQLNDYPALQQRIADRNITEIARD
ncbi:DNA helicase RecG, partial [Candidatus Microgenomates bacterium]|nr:DNA helicase RecG [Candidatus Microgenomates bacterium]